MAAKTGRHPLTGLDVRFGVSTFERWYDAARVAPDPVAVLRSRVRADRGAFPSVLPAARAALQAQYREHPGGTARLHCDNPAATRAGTATPVPSYPSVRRSLKAHGMVRRATPKRDTAGALAARDRLEQRAVRSFEVEHVSPLRHLDFHHGSRKVLTASGTWLTPLLFGVMDDRSRLVCHLQWYTQETAEVPVHGLPQAFMKRGPPRALMTDNGAAIAVRS